MKERRRLKERKLRIDDLTWKESKMRWNLEDIARRERGEGKSIDKLQKDINRRKMVEMRRRRDNEGKVWKEGEKIRPAGRKKRMRGGGNGIEERSKERT